MIERTLYGPMEYLAPDAELRAVLEIRGIGIPQRPFTTHVFLEELGNDALDILIKTANYAGCFTVPGDVSTAEGEAGTVRIDITQALRQAEALRPNFHITFFTESPETDREGRVLHFDEVHIEHAVPLHTELDISADVMGGLVPRKSDR